MNYRLFNRSLFASIALVGAMILFIISGCYKADVVARPQTAQKTADSMSEGDILVCGAGPDADYKGGAAAWLHFLTENCKYPEEAVNGEVSGTVKVQFVIEKDGTISDVKALSGPDILQKEAIRVIKLSEGGWQPGTQNGRAVKSYKTQPIVFKLEI